MNDKNILIGAPLERETDHPLGELLLKLLRVHCQEENTLMVDGITDEKLTADLILRRSICLASWFREENITVGDSVSVNSENRLEFCLVPVACFFVGATFAPLNPQYTPRELRHVLKLSKPKIVFCSDRTVDKIVSILPDNPFIKKVVLFGKVRSKYRNVVMFEEIIRGAEHVNVNEFETTPVDPTDAVATILCSSGKVPLLRYSKNTHHTSSIFPV